MTGARDWTEQIGTDYREAELDAADRRMLDYAAKLTRAPWEMSEDDVLALREAGFTDRAILDIAQVVGYYAYANRIADGLGVSLEAYWAEGKDDY